MTRKQAIGCALLLTAVTAASGQDKLVVSLGSVEKTSDDPKVYVPLQLQGGQNRVGRVVAEIQFPSKGMELLGVEASEGLRNAEGQASFEKIGATGPPNSRVKVTANAKKPIPDGTFAQLIFSVDVSPDEQAIKIEIQASTYDTGGKEISPVTSQSGEISVAPPIFGCFFYMH